MAQSNGSPVGIAAGLIKYANHVEEGLPDIVDHITFGSLTDGPEKGNDPPTVWFNEKTRSSINAVGLTNHGLEAFLSNDLPKLHYLESHGCQIRVSLAPRKANDLKRMIDCLWDYAENSAIIDEIEVNAACPNHRDADGQLHPVLARDRVALEALMQEANHKPPCPMAIKIAPQMSREELQNVVDLAIRFGFDTIVSGNTIPSSSVIDGEQRLSVARGGLAGAVLLDDALAQAHLLRTLIDASGTTHPKPMLIGCGGIMSAEDAKRYFPATPIVQTATYYNQFGVKGMRDMVQELV